MNKGAIVFDLDGTLIDSAPDIRAVANAVLAPLNATKLSLEETIAFIGKGAPNFISQMCAAQNLDRDKEFQRRLLADFEEKYKSATQYSTLYPGALDALTSLRASGLKLGLCTNKPIAPTRSVLNHFGLAGLFDAVAGGNTLKQRKPDPAPLMHVFDALVGSANKRVYVGDSETDAQTAQAAGVPFVLFSGGYRKSPVEQIYHTRLFDRFQDLEQILHDLL